MQIVTISDSPQPLLLPTLNRSIMRSSHQNFVSGQFLYKIASDAVMLMKAVDVVSVSLCMKFSVLLKEASSGDLK